MNLKSAFLGGIALLSVGAANAAVPAEEAKKLGTTLTPVGGEMAGNKDGTIPAYTGGLTIAPAGFDKASGLRPDPFAAEKPSATITGKNLEQYASKLTEGAKALLKKYPDFKIELFPTHRTVAFPKYVLDNTLKNALRAKTTEGGLVLSDAFGGYPFPIPSTGYEAMWNHIVRYSGFAMTTKYTAYNVDSTGHAVISTTGELFEQYPYYDPNKTLETNASDLYYEIKINYTGPSRRAGEGLLVWESSNPIEKGRRAWQYLPGQRRVRLAPDIAYDTPNPGTAGSTTYDDAFTFNGAMDRYDFKLLGKKEMIVPYNQYRFLFGNPEAAATPNFANPAMTRWELHRVWVVEASLKPGVRHIYARRLFYLDEDSWTALASDEFDAKGDLFRSQFDVFTPIYDVPAINTDSNIYYDFVAGSWGFSGIPGTKGAHYPEKGWSDKEWTSDSLAASGVR
jgi:hypothetical protein